MSIEVRPVGVTCNLRCTYCYEQPIRDIDPVLKYDRNKVLAELQNVQHHWSLFGGEALLISLEDLEELLKLAYDRWKQSGIQSNGTLITPAHVALFAKYHTHVGISLDGPDDLNDSRWAGTVEATRNMTARTHAAIDMLLTAANEQNNPKLIPSLIVTIHAGNASVEKWPRMRDWLIQCDQKGIRSINFHVMELDHEATKGSEWYLPHDRLKEVMLELWELSTTFTNMNVTNFKEYTTLLRGGDNTMCVWHACDPWNTSAVQGLEGDGSPSHCTRTNKDGIDWLPAEGMGLSSPWQIGSFTSAKRYHERQLSLYVTPQEHGGCKDCRFWSVCMGQCPGTAEASHGEYGDWRLRSTYCQTWIDMLTEAERRLLDVGVRPLSQHPRLKAIEAALYQSWLHGAEMSLSNAIRVAEGTMSYESAVLRDCVSNSHGDHTDAVRLNIPHGDAHGDHTDVAIQIVPHGDSTNGNDQYVPHGDHTDVAIQTVSHGDEHGDSTNGNDQYVPHGDHTNTTTLSASPQKKEVTLPMLVAPLTTSNIPHGDEHGDHTDAINRW